MELATYPRWHAYILLSLVAVFWAGNVVLGRGIAGAIPPITLNVLRWASGAVTAFLFIRRDSFFRHRR